MARWTAFVALTIVVVIAAAWDCRTHRIPNKLTHSTLLAAPILWALHGFFVGGAGGAVSALGASFGALCVALIPCYLIARNDLLGFGDAKLMGCIGAITASWECVLGTAVYGLIIAMIVSLAMLIRHGRLRSSFMRLYSALVLALSRVKPEIPNDSPRVPVAVCVGIGGIVAGAENLLGYKLLAAYL